ncbi:MAG: prepilin-type N-terminal cleavage/methylation domain-containing protein [Candidatus Pacebacteria bacterium]|nr:prepilin-type N-terminal cleavage/methylation domain-containing protein [Candidatus Paceibacterota bacterium]
MKYIENNRAFTLIELLVVISIISILSAIVIGSLAGARAKSRDARRISDMRMIQQALFTYHLDNGFIPITSSYNASDSGGWDTSFEGDFLSFLVEDGYLSTVPVDPLNNANSAHLNDGYGYLYYCYSVGGNRGLALRFKRESDQSIVNYVTISSFGNRHGSGDDYFECGNHS